MRMASYFIASLFCAKGKDCPPVVQTKTAIRMHNIAAGFRIAKLATMSNFAFSQLLPITRVTIMTLNLTLCTNGNANRQRHLMRPSLILPNFVTLRRQGLPSN